MPKEHEPQKQKQAKITKLEYDQAFDELASFLFRQYKNKKQADLTNEPDEECGQVEVNVS